MVKAVRKRIDTAGEGESDKDTAKQLKQLKEKFEAAMNDDLNTSVALSVVFELVRLANKLLEEGSATAETFRTVDELFGRLGGDVLGIVKDEYPQASGADEEMVDKLVKLLIERRNKARRDKDFELADATRAELDDIGIVLEDKPGGTEWRRK
jgi:cysteinyl-tRNA synthetase